MLPCQCRLADETARLIEAHEAIEGRHVGRVLGRQIRLPRPVALLETQAVHCIQAEIMDSEVLAGFPDQLVDAQQVLERDMQLPAELADIVDPGCNRLGVADIDRADRKPGERLIVEAGRREARQHVARTGPDDDQGTVPRRQVLKPHVTACRRQILLQPVLVVELAGRGTDQPVTLRAQVGQRHLGHDAAARRAQVIQRRAARLRHDTGHHVIEPRPRVPAGHLELREARQIEYRHSLGDRTALAFDRGMPGRPPERQGRTGRITGLGEEHGPLPATPRAERCSLCLQAEIARRGLGRPAGRALLGRVPDAILVLVRLDGLGEHKLVVRVRQVAARVQRPHVPLGLAMDDPLGNRLAGTARLDDAEREAAAVVEPGQARCRAEQGVAVGRIRDGSVDDRLDAHRAEDGHPSAGRLDVFLKPLERIVEELVRKMLRNTIEPMGGCVPFIGSEEQAVAFLPQVVADIRIAHQRQSCRAALDQLGDVLRDQVLVRHRHDRQVRAHHRRDLRAAIAGRVDHPLRADRSLVGMDQPLARRRPLDRRYAGVPIDLRAVVAGTLGERLGHLRGIDVAVVGIVQAGLETVRNHERVMVLQLRRAEKFEVHALGAGLRDNVLEFVDAVARMRQAYAAGDVVVDVVPDSLRERRIQAGAVPLQLHQVPRCREVRAVPGSVPGGPCRQLVSLQQYGVFHAEFRQVIQRAAAHRATTDNDDLCLCFHRTKDSSISRSDAPRARHHCSSLRPRLTQPATSAFRP